MAGMVGRLIVDAPSGPGTLPFGYLKAEGENWRLMPAAAQKAISSAAEIMQKKDVRSPLDFSK